MFARPRFSPAEMAPPPKRLRRSSDHSRRHVAKPDLRSLAEPKSTAQPDHEMRPAGPTYLFQLPPELQQDIFMYVLRPCVDDDDNGEALFRDTVLCLSSVCRTTRGNVVSVVRLLRREISHFRDRKSSAAGAKKCNHLVAMRLLILTLDYNLTTGSAIPIKLGRFKKPCDGRRATTDVAKQLQEAVLEGRAAS